MKSTYQRLGREFCMTMGDFGGGDEELPLYAEVEVDDGPPSSPDTAALVLGVSAGGLALVGDVLIPTHAGQAFVSMAVAVVLVSVARIVNRGRSHGSRDADAKESSDLGSDDLVIDLRAADDREEVSINRAR
jgi:hypothetical protein